MSTFYCFLMALSSLVSLCHAEESKDLLIRQVLQEANVAYFQDKSMQVELLRDRPDLITTLVGWQFSDWSSYDRTLTEERLYADFASQFDKEGIPFTLVLLKDGQPIGSIALDYEAEPELADLPGPWPGSFHVIKPERNRGLGKLLGNVVISIAKKFGHNQVYFYTSNPENVDKYVKNGAAVLETRPFRRHTITVMSMNISNMR